MNRHRDEISHTRCRPCPRCGTNLLRTHNWAICAHCAGTPWNERVRPSEKAVGSGRRSIGNIAGQIARWLKRATRTEWQVHDLWRTTRADSRTLLLASAWLTVAQLEAFVHVVVPHRVAPRYKAVR